MPLAAAAGGGPRVWLEVPDADAAAAELTAAGTAVAAPFDVATGRTVEITDPWGNVVGLTDYSKAPERGRQP
jgi:predicted enzyme related to lactoylglutathione lyase